MNQETLAVRGKQDGPAPVTRRAVDLKLGTAFVETRHGSTVILTRAPRPAGSGRVSLNWEVVTAAGITTARGVLTTGANERLVIDYANSLAALMDRAEYAEADADRAVDDARATGNTEDIRRAGDALWEARCALTRLATLHGQIAEQAAGIAA